MPFAGVVEDAADEVGAAGWAPAVTLVPGLSPSAPPRHDLGLGVQPLGDLDQVLIAHPGHDRRARGLAVLHDPHPAIALFSAQRAVREGQRVARVAGGHPGDGEHAADELAGRVVDLRAHAQRTGRGVELRNHRDDGAVEGLAGQRRDLERQLAASDQAVRRLRRDVGHELHGAGIDDVQDRLVLGDVLVLARVALDHHAGDRRHDAMLRQGGLGDRDVGLRLRDLRVHRIGLRRQRVHFAAGADQGLLVQGLGVEQALRAGELGLGVLQIHADLLARRARHRDRGLGPLQVRAGHGVVDEGQELVGLDMVALIHRQLDDVAFDLRRQVGERQPAGSRRSGRRRARSGGASRGHQLDPRCRRLGRGGGGAVILVAGDGQRQPQHGCDP